MSAPASRRGFMLASLALLGGCASAPPRPAGDLAGRLALRVDAAGEHPARSFSADFDLRGDAREGTLRLTGPLGAMLAEVAWRPGAAELKDGQGQRRYASLDALAQDLFGEPLPLAALVDWLRGRPWPGAPSRPLADGFEQLDWRIGLAGLADGLVEARRERAPGVSLRARLERPA